MPESLTQNPNLTNWSDNDTVVLQDWSQEDTVKNVVIERPKYWTYRKDNTRVQNAPNRVPQSFHVDATGFKLSAGYFPWYAGYAQRVNGLEAGKRYLLKIVYQNQLHDTTKVEAVRCRGEIFGTAPLVGDWQQLPHMKNSGQEQTYLLVFEMQGDGDVEVAFMTENLYGEGATDIVVSYIGLEPVADDYGGANVPVVVPMGTSEPAPDPDDDEPLPDPDDDSPTGDTDGSFITLTLSLNLHGETEAAFSEFWLALARWVDRQ